MIDGKFWRFSNEGLTRGTGYGGAALVLGLLHHAVLAYGLDEGAHSKYLGVKLSLVVEALYLRKHINIWL